ncbi:MFS transporter [Streptomyces sp. NPDC056045]|uniref:MFS transporter n=1 Tax=Streptomyces sp. NPDC056045 TaxID=3345691 RepID=UPI0035DA0298
MTSLTTVAQRVTVLPAPLAFAFLLGAFALGTSENVIAGIIGQLSASLGVPVASVGLLMTAYAATAVVAGPVLALVTPRVPMRMLAPAVVGVYAAGSVLAVFAPSYEALLAARILTGAMHTTALVCFMLTAIRFAPADQRAGAVARITLGLGIATVLGVPVGNWLAEAFDWRWAFALIAALIIGTFVIVLMAVPREDVPRGTGGWSSLRVLARPAVGGGVAMSALAGLGAMSLLAYAVPFLTEGAGAAPEWVAPIMLAYGLACLLGNAAGGRLADRDLRRAITLAPVLALVALASALLLSGWLWGAVIGLALVGFAYFSTFPPLNTWIAAHADGVAPDLALAVNSSAFNIGVALAGWLGATALGDGLDPARLPVLGLAPLALCAAVGALLVRREVRSAKTATV